MSNPAADRRLQHQSRGQPWPSHTTDQSHVAAGQATPNGGSRTPALEEAQLRRSQSWSVSPGTNTARALRSSPSSTVAITAAARTTASHCADHDRQRRSFSEEQQQQHCQREEEEESSNNIHTDRPATPGVLSLQGLLRRQQMMRRRKFFSDGVLQTPWDAKFEQRGRSSSTSRPKVHQDHCVSLACVCEADEHEGDQEEVFHDGDDLDLVAHDQSNNVTNDDDDDAHSETHRVALLSSLVEPELRGAWATKELDELEVATSSSESGVCDGDEEDDEEDDDSSLSGEEAGSLLSDEDQYEESGEDSSGNGHEDIKRQVVEHDGSSCSSESQPDDTDPKKANEQVVGTSAPTASVTAAFAASVIAPATGVGAGDDGASSASTEETDQVKGRAVVTAAVKKISSRRTSAARMRRAYLDRLGFDDADPKRAKARRKHREAHPRSTMGPQARRAALASRRSRRRPAFLEPLKNPKRETSKRSFVKKIARWIVGEDDDDDDKNNNNNNNLSSSPSPASSFGSTVGSPPSALRRHGEQQQQQQEQQQQQVQHHKQQLKSVSFHTHTSVYFVPMRREFSPDVRRAMWPSRQEFVTMVMRNMDQVEAEMNAPPEPAPSASSSPPSTPSSSSTSADHSLSEQPTPSVPSSSSTAAPSPSPLPPSSSSSPPPSAESALYSLSKQAPTSEWGTGQQVQEQNHVKGNSSTRAPPLPPPAKSPAHVLASKEEQQRQHQKSSAMAGSIDSTSSEWSGAASDGDSSVTLSPNIGPAPVATVTAASVPSIPVRPVL